MFGLLLEREGLLSSAKRALESALTSLASQNPNGELPSKVRMNLGRVSFKRGDFADAVGHYAAVEPQDFDSLCGQAISLFK